MFCPFDFLIRCSFNPMLGLLPLPLHIQMTTYCAWLRACHSSRYIAAQDFRTEPSAISWALVMCAWDHVIRVTTRGCLYYCSDFCKQWMFLLRFAILVSSGFFCLVLVFVLEAMNFSDYKWSNWALTFDTLISVKRWIRYLKYRFFYFAELLHFPYIFGICW